MPWMRPQVARVGWSDRPQRRESNSDSRASTESLCSAAGAARMSQSPAVKEPLGDLLGARRKSGSCAVYHTLRKRVTVSTKSTIGGMVFVDALLSVEPDGR